MSGFPPPNGLRRFGSGSLAEENGSFWTYVLENNAGKFYIGSTSDFAARLERHNDPTRDRVAYTSKHMPWTLVWSESHDTRASAMAREKQIKCMKSAKWFRRELLGKR